jgi:prepilin-type N-terminal cleavage/methylation domain-containing protein/prepilin-type processing-associated H-X9-DG protein
MPQKFLRAFTLVEMLVVIAIIAVLAALLFPAIAGMQERGKSTQDMSNLRQIGTATQLYLNDNDNNFYPATTIWMSELNPKYVGTWKIFLSPFDHRSASEVAANAPVSYGLNQNAVGILADKVTNPSGFIAFAPAQAAGTTVSFQGMGVTAAPGVTVQKDADNVGGPAVQGTHNSRKKINVVFADWHVETMLWGTAGVSGFVNDKASPTDPDPGATQRWTPTPP